MIIKPEIETVDILYKIGIFLSPAAGAVLMNVSAVVVAINASLIKVKTPVMFFIRCCEDKR